MPEITAIFAKPSNVTVPEKIKEEGYKPIEKLFIVLYSTTTKTDDINIAR